MATTYHRGVSAINAKSHGEPAQTAALEAGGGPCYSVTVTVRYLALAIASIAVVGAGVYLFVEVKATPAQAQPGATPAAPAARPTAPIAEASESPPVAPPPPATPHAPPQVIPNVRVDPHPPPPPPPGLAGGPDIPTGDDVKIAVKLDEAMDQANKAYDQQEFEDARKIAARVLAKQPNNIRMLRIMVSSSCIDGDPTVAQKYYPMLPKFDQAQMKARCDRYGITFDQ
jgi:hypothetical protein